MYNSKKFDNRNLHITIGPDEIYLARKMAGGRTTFKPRSTVPEWPISLPLDWGANPFEDTNWQFQLHSWRMTDPLLERFFENGSNEDIEFAAEIANDWWTWHQHKNATFSWNDMATGIRSLRIAFLLSAVDEGILNAGFRPSLLEMAKAHFEKLQSEGFITSGNHGLFQVFGLALLCTVADLDNRNAGLKYAEDKFQWILSRQFTEDGVHKENSPTYHRFATTVIRNLGGSERFKLRDIETILRNADAVEPWLIFPNGMWPSIGDSYGFAGKVDSLSGGRRQSRSDGRAYAVSSFERSGYAVVRSEDPQGSSMLIVTGMAHTYTHKHADELSFELFEHGRLIFIDAGKYGYAQDSIRSYIESACAHNTISVDGEYIGRHSVKLGNVILDETRILDDRFIISGELHRRDMFRQRRIIEYNPGNWITIEDQLSSDGSRAFVSSLHLSPDLHPVVNENGFSIELGERTINGTLIGDECKIEAIRGQSSPEMIGWSTTGYLKVEPTFVIRAVSQGRCLTIKWKIDL